MKRYVGTTSEQLFLTPELPIFINRVSESFELAEHTHDFVEINYVGDGRGFHHLEGITLPVEKGDLFFLPVGVSHVFRPAARQSKGSRLIVYNCVFNAAFARRLAASFPLRDDMLRLLLGSYPEQPWRHWKDRNGVFQTIFDAMYEEYAGQRADFPLLLQAEAVRLLVQMRRALLPVPPATDPVRADDPFENAVAAIRDRAHERLRLTELAAAAGLSERQFRRRLLERTGMGFTEYVRKLRIERSRELLRTTDDKLDAVAQKCGYEDAKFFGRLFKAYTGMTPGQYRASQ